MTDIDPGEPSTAAQMTEGALRRLDLFNAAYEAVQGREWGATPDVVRVAEFLADGERD
ncbi:hypothetical protein OTB20_08500 [Streptomyces sp. H27-H1]|uniref:hypothetical protein n=1 Tax=Streptomyces sp. H27-H1 TaxID=2996461 RepID=UPI00226FE62C|nr:hypothetical protein [Streptomyces sp. H27-H1]MCY0926245.1 hypothetical protein [Streptomyces sp. H27-H1]